MSRSSYLSEELEAGSARVFNVLARSQEIAKEDGERTNLLFATPALNRVVFLKETATENTFDGQAGRSLTKLYAPYNEAVPHEGGASIFVEDAVLERVLASDFGFDRKRDPDGASRDAQVLEMIRDLPTLDPFLVKDKAEMEELPIDPRYLALDPDEEKRIQNHILKRFQSMVDFAFGDEADSERGKQRLKRLVRKLWEGQDMDELAPIIKALELPPDQAAGIFYAWKGILYYDYRTRQLQEGVDGLLHYLRKKIAPRDTPTRPQREALKESRDEALKGLARTWASVNQTLNKYNSAYDTLFRDRKSPKPFIQFMQNAEDYFWDLGKALARADHAVDFWKLNMARADEDGLRVEDLQAMLNAMVQIQQGH